MNNFDIRFGDLYDRAVFWVYYLGLKWIRGVLVGLKAVKFFFFLIK